MESTTDGELLDCSTSKAKTASSTPSRDWLVGTETEIVEIWSRLIEQLAENVILFGMSINKGIGAQDTNPTRQSKNHLVALWGLCLVHLFPYSYQTVSCSQQAVQ